MNDPRGEYEKRVAQWVERIARHDRTHLLLANLRLATAAAGAFVAVWVFRERLSAWWLVPPILVFAVLVVIHAEVLQRSERARRARRLYERGIERLTDRWSGAGRDGARFLEGHGYARDLDLFGRGSLFERLNSARTETGEATLAAWLSAGAPGEEIHARQAAVGELRPMLDFREDLAVLADEAQVPDVTRLIAWANSTPVTFSRALPLLFAGSASVSVVLFVLAYRWLVPWSFPVGWVLAQAALMFIWRRRIHHVLHSIETPERDLTLLTGLLERIERQRFSAPFLVDRQAALSRGGLAASRAIRRLRSLVSLADSSIHNLFFMPVARVLLLPEQLAIAIGRWHAAYGRSVAEWLRLAGELEAIASIAAYAYERPVDPFPTVVDAGVLFEAAALGHPLISDDLSVRNDLSLGGDHPHVIVVSGSNMSGKSTLLRAVGVNVALALAGAPVRASKLRLSRLAIGATLRTDDSLQQGHSRFYAEILRLRRIMDLARGGSPVIFLLDEILHGTNSYDRRQGAEAIVRGLVKLGAVGLVTTHDLALTEMVSVFKPAATNMHFEDRMEGGQMIFDYRMRPGVVEHSNALALMRAVGLDV